jgi:two-component system response regulator HydG
MADGNQHLGLTIERRKPLPFPSGLDNEPLSGISTVLAGNSAAITRLRSQLRRIAPYFRTALLTGEQGCGDVAVARALHELSPLRERVFLELAPAETKLWLSGGGASASLATAGMIYIPQPERLDRAEQAALLRLLRTRGAYSPRIVAYAEHGLRPLVSSLGFLPELAATLGSLQIALPPLRERPDDIPALLDGILRGMPEAGSLPSLSPSLLEAAKTQPWPGNLDQLESIVRRMLERSNGAPLDATALLEALDALPRPTHDRRAVRLVRLDQIIQEHVRAVLFACGGNKLRAAEILGISRSTLYRMLDTPMPSPSLAPEMEDHMLLAG